MQARATVLVTGDETGMPLDSKWQGSTQLTLPYLYMHVRSSRSLSVGCAVSSLFPLLSTSLISVNNLIPIHHT